MPADLRARDPSPPARARRALGGLLLALCGAVGCSPGDGSSAPPGPSAANVFLVVMDAASAFHFGPWGAPEGVSPHIDALAEEWVVFENAYSQSATTVATTASLITGVRGTTHRMTSRTVLSDRYRTAAEILREAGYRGFAFVANPFAGAAVYGYDRGYARAVQIYALESLRGSRPLEKRSHFVVSRPADVNEQVFEALEDFAPAGTFVYLHYLQPHRPYDPPAELLDGFLAEGLRAGEPGWRDWNRLDRDFAEANRTGRATPETVEILRSRYRANVRFVDAGVGALMDALRERDLYDDALILLTSDHGDAFFEHRRFGHNVDLYDDMTRVPLMIKFPEREGIEARRLPQLVETVDLLPTILDYLGVGEPGYLEGDSLWPLVRGDASALPGPEVILSTTRLGRHAIRLGDYKYIRDHRGGEELYHLGRDPGEQEDLVAEEAEVAGFLRARLESAVDLETELTAEPAPDLRSDPEMRRLLETLGYLEPSIPDAVDLSEPEPRGAGL